MRHAPEQLEMLSVEASSEQRATQARCSLATGSAPTMSKKRRAILEYLAINKSITLTQATHLVGRNIYHNAEKHTGSLLSVMVKLKMIVRTKPGLFALPNTLLDDTRHYEKT